MLSAFPLLGIGKRRPAPVLIAPCPPSPKLSTQAFFPRADSLLRSSARFSEPTFYPTAQTSRLQHILNELTAARIATVSTLSTLSTIKDDERKGSEHRCPLSNQSSHTLTTSSAQPAAPFSSLMEPTSENTAPFPSSVQATSEKASVVASFCYHRRPAPGQDKEQPDFAKLEEKIKIALEQQAAVNNTGLSALNLLFRKVRDLPGIGERVGIIWGRLLSLFDPVTDLWRRVNGMETRFSVLSQTYERFQREVSVTLARQEAVIMQQSMIITSQGSALQQQVQRVTELLGEVQYLASKCSSPQRRDSDITFSDHTPSLLSSGPFGSYSGEPFTLFPR
ncbi:hypothetical protein HDU67_009305 [Dinochytrium kinnereticum]|nr:hypothetical protein HDU67_009305 [Dinochytrium kinnereticum]